jgi:hypothetical protein
VKTFFENDEELLNQIYSHPEIQSLIEEDQAMIS